MRERRLTLTELTADLTHPPFPFGSPLNAIAYLALGLWHDDEHLAQIRGIVRQTLS